MEIRVQEPQSGRVVRLEVEPSHTARAVVEVIVDGLKLPEGPYALIFSGHQIASEKTLSNAGVMDGDLLKLGTAPAAPTTAVAATTRRVKTGAKIGKVRPRPQTEPISVPRKRPEEPRRVPEKQEPLAGARTRSATAAAIVCGALGAILICYLGAAVSTSSASAAGSLFLQLFDFRGPGPYIIFNALLIFPAYLLWKFRVLGGMLAILLAVIALVDALNFAVSQVISRDLAAIERLLLASLIASDAFVIAAVANAWQTLR